MALVTTIIPTFRRPRMLAGAIESALGQTFEDLEVHVYDDASGDDTAAVVQSISRRDSRVHYFCHPNHLGMMANFDYAMAHVKSPYFQIMSDDDLLLPDFFRIGVGELERNLAAMLFIGRLIIAQPDGYVFRVTGDMWKEGIEYPPDTFIRVAGGDPWTSMIFRREVLARVGTLDPEVGPAGDHDFEMRVAALYPAIISNALCAIFCIHPASRSVGDPLTPLLSGIPRTIQNVNRVIDLGVRDRLITSDAGQTMRSAMVAGLHQQLATMALVAVCRGRRDVAIAAARFLEADQCNGRTLLLRALANSSLLWPLVSTAYTLARASCRVWRKYKYAELAMLVSNAFRHAGSPFSTG